MRHCFAALWMAALPGCALIGSAGHEERIDALGAVDTDVDTDPPTGMTPPDVTDLAVRFRFDELAFYDGMHLVFRASDVDGDLVGGELIVDGQTIPLSDAVAREGDYFSVPVDYMLPSNPCDATPTESVTLTVIDANGASAGPFTVPIEFTTFRHDETGVTSADQCEPCVSGIALAEMPALVCGFKGIEVEYIDGYDDTQLAIGANTSIEATVNYAPSSDDLRFDVFFGDAFGEPAFGAPDNPVDFGEQVVFTTPESPTAVTLSIWREGSSGVFFEGGWALYIQPPLPAVVQ